MVSVLTHSWKAKWEVVYLKIRLIRFRYLRDVINFARPLVVQYQGSCGSHWIWCTLGHYSLLRYRTFSHLQRRLRLRRLQSTSRFISLYLCNNDFAIGTTVVSLTQTLRDSVKRRIRRNNTFSGLCIDHVLIYPRQIWLQAILLRLEQSTVAHGGQINQVNEMNFAIWRRLQYSTCNARFNRFYINDQSTTNQRKYNFSFTFFQTNH